MLSPQSADASTDALVGAAHVRALRCGETAALLELEDLTAVLELYAALQQDKPSGVGELVPAAKTLLVNYDPLIISFAGVSRLMAERRRVPAPAQALDAVTVATRYDGSDLAEVARAAGLSERQVVERHSGGEYVAAFCGFAPGFSYLTGLDESLHLPRRPSPRAKVPPGAVAIADEFTAVYPSSSPGGWHIIGHTDMAVWDTNRNPPTLLAPGTPVRFVEVAP